MFQLRKLAAAGEIPDTPLAAGYFRDALNTKGNRRIFWAGKRFCGLDIIPGWVCRNAGGFVEEIVSLLYYQLL